MQKVAQEARHDLPAPRKALRRRQRKRQAQQLVNLDRHRQSTSSSRATHRTRTLSSSSSSARSSKPSTSIRICSASRSPPPATTTVSARTRLLPPSSPCSSATDLAEILEAVETGKPYGAKEKEILRIGVRYPSEVPEGHDRQKQNLAVRLHRQQVRVQNARFVRLDLLREHRS